MNLTSRSQLGKHQHCACGKQSRSTHQHKHSHSVSTSASSHLLSHYKSELPTRSCFLDGRYIALVLADVPEFHKQVIHIDLEFDAAQGLMHADIRGSAAISEGMNIVRVVIESPTESHSALVWIDTRSQTIVYSDVVEQGDKLALEHNKAVDKLIKDFYSHLNYTYSRDVAIVKLEDDPNCEMFGYCNAYVIKQVLDYVADAEFDPSEIRRFAGAIEKEYAHLLDPNTEPEVEYRGGRGGYGGGRGYGGRGYGGYGRGGYGYGGAGLGLGLGVLGGVALGSAIASRPYYQQPYYAQPYYPPYGYY